MSLESSEGFAARRAAQASLERLMATVPASERSRLAHQHKAFQRARAIDNPDRLLVLLLFYTFVKFSLRLTSWFARVAYNLTICDQSLGERFQNCGPWLRALVIAQLAATTRLAVPLRTRLRIVDGSVLCRPGAEGTEWRVHMVFEPGASAPTSVEVTDAHGAEGLDQGVQQALTLDLGDRNYGRYKEVKAARDNHVNLLARTHLQTQPLNDADGTAHTPRHWTALADRQLCDHVVQVTRGEDPPPPARLIMVALPAEVAGRARQKVRKAASKKGKTPNELALHLAGYLCLLTTLNNTELSVVEACSLYRIRWQVECFFKRAKSLAFLGAIHGGTKLVEAQIWARLLSLCGHETQRPWEANVRPLKSARTGRPPTPWRWLQCLRLVWLAPLAMLAALGARGVSAAEQDNALRERPRQRGVRDLLDSFPFLAPEPP